MKNVLLQQIETPSKKDWIYTVKEDLQEFEINIDFEEISSLSKKQFKIMVKNACRMACFKSLMKDRENLS